MRRLLRLLAAHRRLPALQADLEHRAALLEDQRAALAELLARPWQDEFGRVRPGPGRAPD